MKDKKKAKKSAEVSSSTVKDDEDQEIAQLTVRKQQESPMPGQQRSRFFNKFNKITMLQIFILLLPTAL